MLDILYSKAKSLVERKYSDWEFSCRLVMRTTLRSPQNQFCSLFVGLLDHWTCIWLKFHLEKIHEVFGLQIVVRTTLHELQLSRHLYSSGIFSFPGWCTAKHHSWFKKNKLFMFFWHLQPSDSALTRWPATVETDMVPWHFSPWSLPNCEATNASVES